MNYNKSHSNSNSTDHRSNLDLDLMGNSMLYLIINMPIDKLLTKWVVFFLANSEIFRIIFDLFNKCLDIVHSWTRHLWFLHIWLIPHKNFSICFTWCSKCKSLLWGYLKIWRTLIGTWWRLLSFYWTMKSITMSKTSSSTWSIGRYIIVFVTSISRGGWIKER